MDSGKLSERDQNGRRHKNIRHKQYGVKKHDMYQLVFDDNVDEDDDDGGKSADGGSEEDDQSLSPSERVARILGNREPDIDVARWPSDNCDISATRDLDSNENYEATELQFRYSPSLELNASDAGSQRELDSLDDDKVEGGELVFVEDDETEFVKIVKTSSPQSQVCQIENNLLTGGVEVSSQNSQDRGFLNPDRKKSQTSPNKTNIMLAVRYIKPSFIESEDNYIDDDIQSYPMTNDDNAEYAAEAKGLGQATLPDVTELHYDEDAALDLPSIDTESWAHGRTNDDDLEPIIFMNASNDDGHRPQRWSDRHKKVLIFVGVVSLIFMLAAFGAVLYFVVKAFT